MFGLPSLAKRPITGQRHGNIWLVTIGALIVALAVAPQSARAAVQRVKFQSGNNYLIVEFLNDDLLHFELSAPGPGPDTASPIFTGRLGSRAGGPATQSPPWRCRTSA